MIGGMPAARMGDQTAHGGLIALGCMTVLIGDGASGGSGGGAGTAQAMAMLAAKRGGKAFCEECARLVGQPKKLVASASAQSQTFRAARSLRLPFCEECAKP
jgi:hypothetical protein